MLSPAVAGSLSILMAPPWGLRPRLYAYACVRRLRDFLCKAVSKITSPKTAGLVPFGLPRERDIAFVYYEHPWGLKQEGRPLRPPFFGDLSSSIAAYLITVLVPSRETGPVNFGEIAKA